MKVLIIYTNICIPAPLYHSQHIVKPAYWSYGGDGESEELRMVNFAIPLHTLNPNKQVKLYTNSSAKFA